MNDFNHDNLILKSKVQTQTSIAFKYCCFLVYHGSHLNATQLHSKVHAAFEKGTLVSKDEVNKPLHCGNEALNEF